MRKFLVAILALLIGFNSYSQSTSITGTIIDTSGKKNLQHAVVSLLKKDSTLHAFTFSMNKFLAGSRFLFKKSSTSGGFFTFDSSVTEMD